MSGFFEKRKNCAPSAVQPSGRANGYSSVPLGWHVRFVCGRWTSVQSKSKETCKKGGLASEGYMNVWLSGVLKDGGKGRRANEGSKWLWSWCWWWSGLAMRRQNPLVRRDSLGLGESAPRRFTGGPVASGRYEVNCTVSLSLSSSICF